MSQSADTHDLTSEVGLSEESVPNTIPAQLIILLLVALLVRALLLVSQSAVLWPDSLAYLEWAERIASEANYSHHPVFRTPGYPTFLAAFLVFGSGFAVGKAVIAVQYLLGIVSTLFLFLIGRRLFAPSVGFVAGLIFSVHPLELYYETVIQTEALFVPVFIALLYATTRAFDSPTKRRFAALGGIAAVLSLIRPMAQLLIILIAAGYGLSRDKKVSYLPAIFSMAGAFAVCVLPWMISNSRNYEFFGLSQDVGLNSFHRVFDNDGLEPSAPEHEEMRRVAMREREKGKKAYFTVVSYFRKQGLGYAEIDRSMLRFTIAAVRENPLPYLKRTVHCFLNFFFAPDNSIDFSESEGAPFLSAPQAGWIRTETFPNRPELDLPAIRMVIRALVSNFFLQLWLITPIAAYGFFEAYRRRSINRSRYTLFGSFILYFAVLVAVFNTPEDRFSLLILPILLLFAAHGIIDLANRGVRMLFTLRANTASV